MDRLSHLIAAGCSDDPRAALHAKPFLFLTPDDWRALLVAAEQALEHHADAAVDKDATERFYAAADAAKSAHHLIEQAVEDEAREPELPLFGISYGREELPA